MILFFLGLSLILRRRARDCGICFYVCLVIINIRQYGRRFAYLSRHFIIFNNTKSAFLLSSSDILNNCPLKLIFNRSIDCPKLLCCHIWAIFDKNSHTFERNTIENNEGEKIQQMFIQKPLTHHFSLRNIERIESILLIKIYNMKC